MENAKELSDIKTTAEEFLRQVPIISVAAIVPVLPPNREVILERTTALTMKICEIFKIAADTSSVNKWISKIFNTCFPTIPTVMGSGTVNPIMIKRELDYGHALIDLCCKVKCDEISQDVLWGEEGVRMMVSLLCKKHT